MTGKHFNRTLRVHKFTVGAVSNCCFASFKKQECKASERSGKLGQTAQFCPSYMDFVCMILILLVLIKAQTRMT